jgi:hypothetical protein
VSHVSPFLRSARFAADATRAPAACQRAPIPRIKIHPNNGMHRRTAMIAKDLILAKDNYRMSA